MSASANPATQRNIPRSPESFTCLDSPEVITISIKRGWGKRETKKVFYCQQYCEFLCASGCNNTLVPLTVPSPQTHKTSTITGNFYITKAIFLSGLYSEWGRWLKQNVPTSMPFTRFQPDRLIPSATRLSSFYCYISLSHWGYKTLCEKLKKSRDGQFLSSGMRSRDNSSTT
jgi:hypothetical protein